MMLSDQAAALLEATELGLIQLGEVMRWVDGIVRAMDDPPEWITELYALSAEGALSFESAFRQYSTGTLSVRQQVQIILVAHEAGKLSLRSTLSKLFLQVVCPNDVSVVYEPLDEQLVDALVYWECHDDLDVFDEPLHDKLAEIFREYLSDADEVAAVLPWRLENNA